MFHMNIDKQKAHLEEQRENLLKDIEKIGVKDSSDPGGFIVKEEKDYAPNDVNDDIDQADEQEMILTNNALLGDLETRLKNVEKALENIENGNYGKCEKCQGEIEGERIMANPSANTCISCM